MSATSGAEASHANGAATGPHDDMLEARSLADHGRQIRHDAEALAGAVQDATDGVQRYLREQAESRPYRTVGVAVGIGYLLGGGLRSRLTAMVLAAVTRLAMALAAREVAARLLQGNAPPFEKTAPEHSSGAAKEHA